MILGVTFASFHAFVGNPALAHGGDTPAAASGPVIAPRAEARSGPLELVAVYSRDTLALFVTRYGDGAPVAGAQIEGGSELETVTLAETDPGVYMTRELVIPPGRNDLKFTITQAGEPVREQALTLMVQGGLAVAPKASGPQAGRTNSLLIGAAVLAVYSVMTVAFVVARRQTGGASGGGALRTRLSGAARRIGRLAVRRRAMPRATTTAQADPAS